MEPSGQVPLFGSQSSMEEGATVDSGCPFEVLDALMEFAKELAENNKNTATTKIDLPILDSSVGYSLKSLDSVTRSTENIY